MRRSTLRSVGSAWIRTRDIAQTSMPHWPLAGTLPRRPVCKFRILPRLPQPPPSPARPPVESGVRAGVPGAGSEFHACPFPASVVGHPSSSWVLCDLGLDPDMKLHISSFSAVVTSTFHFIESRQAFVPADLHNGWKHLTGHRHSAYVDFIYVISRVVRRSHACG